MITFICTRCKAKIRGKDEYLAELAFNEHVCKGMRSLFEMDMDLLKATIDGKMSEDEAWKEQDERR